MQMLFLFSDSPSLTPFKGICAEPWMSLPVLSQGLSRDLQQLDKVGRKEEPLPGGRSEGRGGQGSDNSPMGSWPEAVDSRS